MKEDGVDSKPADEVASNRRRIHELLYGRGPEIDLALKRGVREALLLHKKLGNPIYMWRDGAVVEVAPEDIPV